jgi:hypothetical protein
MLLSMRPADICKDILGKEKLDTVLDEMSSPQIKAALKEGNLKVKLPGGYVSQSKRRTLWKSKINAAIEQDNHELAAEVLQQWLLNHRRMMLIGFLDRLGVKHRDGETDDSFLISNSAEKVREAARWLLGQHERVETTAYLHYIAYQQKTQVFDGWEGLSVTVGEQAGGAGAGGAEAGGAGAGGAGAGGAGAGGAETPTA